MRCARHLCRERRGDPSRAVQGQTDQQAQSALPGEVQNSSVRTRAHRGVLSCTVCPEVTELTAAQLNRAYPAVRARTHLVRERMWGSTPAGLNVPSVRTLSATESLSNTVY